MSTQLQLAENQYKSADKNTLMYVTMRIDSQLFGIPVRYVRDVLRKQLVMPIPLAPEEVEGSLNLRGRIVTVINLRRRLRLPPQPENIKGMLVVVEHHNDLYSLMIDSVGDVLSVPSDAVEKVPGNLGVAWKEVASGIFKLEKELLVMIDIDMLLLMKQN